jgi:hypothetical protein
MHELEGTGAHKLHGARVEATIVPAVIRSKVSMHKTARSNCHIFKLLHLERGRALTASMPAAARRHCILRARDLKMLAFVLVD